MEAQANRAVEPWRWTSSKTRKAFSADQQRLISQESKHPEDDTNLVGTTTLKNERTETTSRNERKEALRDLRIRTLGSDSTRTVHGSRHHAQARGQEHLSALAEITTPVCQCRSSTWQEKLSGLLDAGECQYRDCQCRDSKGMENDIMASQVTQTGRSI